MSVADAHAICDRIEATLRAELEGLVMSIHVELEGKGEALGGAGAATLSNMATVRRIDSLARSIFDLFSIMNWIVGGDAQFRSLAEPGPILLAAPEG